MNRTLTLILTLILLSAPTYAAPARPHAVPAGAVVFWPAENGPIPAGWHEYEPAQGRFLLGADPGHPPGQSGGQATIDLAHNHPLRLTTAELEPRQGIDGYTPDPAGAEVSVMPPYLAGTWIQKDLDKSKGSTP